MGLGAGAHGHAAGVRYQIVKQPRVYLRRLEEADAPGYPLSTAVATSHSVSRAEAISDTMMTRLRLLNEGLDLAAFQAQFGQSVTEVYNGTLDQMLEWELVRVEDGRLRLTQKGWFLSNQVFYRFMLDDA